jgi:transcriptional regulator with XRE-family HTH domain
MIDKKNSLVNPCQGEILRDLRERLGLTQAELASRLGLGLRSVNGAERGERELWLNLSQIVKLIELLDQANMSIYDLVRNPRKDHPAP